MANCCTNGVKDLGCFASCDLVQFGEIAMQSGDYTVEIQPDLNTAFLTHNTQGNPLFVTNRFNESGTTTFKLIQPDGTYFTASKGEDCFKVTNEVAITPSIANTTIVPITCPDATVDNSAGTELGTVISGGTFVTGDSTVFESDGVTTVVVLPSEVNHALAGATVTDAADSSTTTLEDGDSYSCIKRLIVRVYFTNGTDTITVNGEPGVIISESTDGGSTFTYNGNAFAAWGKVWGGDVIIVRSSSAGAEILTLEGTYT